METKPRDERAMRVQREMRSNVQVFARTKRNITSARTAIGNS